MEAIASFTDEQLFNDILDDEIEIHEAIKESAKHGDGIALYQIGKIYYNNANYAKAMAWFQRSALKNNSDAQFRIGYMFDIGEGVPVDFKLAMRWYKIAANNGDSTAKNNIGCIYDNGNGVPVNYKLAMEWYLKSAESNNPNAQWNIGVLYEYGLGVVKDKKQALEWYHRGANQGFEKAEERVQILNAQGIYIDANQKAILNVEKRTCEMRRDFQEKIDSLELKNKELNSELTSLQLLNHDLQDEIVLLKREKKEEYARFIEKLENMEYRMNIMERETKIQRLENQVRALKLKGREKKAAEEKYFTKKESIKNI